jgi:hypothetical protein
MKPTAAQFEEMKWIKLSAACFCIAVLKSYIFE